MQALPIDSVLPDLCESLASVRTLVLEAPAGAGKTTRVPIALLEAGLAGDREVLVSEPRRLAARMAARRVATERGERLGDRIGYSVRFEQVRGPKTRLSYVTEGVLLRRLLEDPTLRNVGAVILDEFHERHLDTDLLLGLLKRLKDSARSDLSLVVMSATLDAEPVSEFLGKCPRIRSEGRLFPLEIEHLPAPDERPLEKQVVSAVRRLVELDPTGDVLVFLPGASEIRRAAEALGSLARERRLLVVPLHGDLSMDDQVRAIEPASEQKVVLSTNVAESSVTIEGVTGVVDCGLARVATHSPFTGLPSLTVEKVSRASATQRAGRAGRTRAGRVLRLYTRGDFVARPEHDVPEIARADLAEAWLLVAGAGVHKDRPLAWLTPPPAAHASAAEELLSMLSAFDADGQLSATGRRMLDLPLHPRLGRILVEGERRGVAQQAALLVSLVQERDLRLSTRTDFNGRQRGADTATGPSDLLELVDAFELARSLGFERQRLQNHGLDARSAEAVLRSEKQLERLIDRREAASDLDPEQVDSELLICVLSGFVDRLARRRKAGGLELILATGKNAKLSPNSVVRSEELLVAVDVEDRSLRGGLGEATVRLASAVRPEWLLDLYSDRLTLTDELAWNPASERVERTSRMAFGAVVLDETRTPAPPGPEASRVLSRAIETVGAQEFLRHDSVIELAERMALVSRMFPTGSAPDFDPGDFHATVVALAEGRTSFRELRELDLSIALAESLGSDTVRWLDRQAPQSVRLPSSRSVPVHYEPGKPPWIESRLQDFFGMSEGPSLCDGKLPVTLHLLAPNGRAVQVTTDLTGFWDRHYPSIRRELSRRYPRHSWPDDGRHAEPPKPRSRR